MNTEPLAIASGGSVNTGKGFGSAKHGETRSLYKMQGKLSRRPDAQALWQ